MAGIDISSGKTILSTGLLQLQNGVAMSSTLTPVTDQSNTASQLKLSTNLTQIAGTLQIHTDTTTYIDAEDGSGNNRFTISRDPSSQQVNVDFASKPTDLTTIVGALRTYADGTNLSESLRFQENGNAIANYLGIAGGASAYLSTLHLTGSQIFQVGNPIATNQYMVIDSLRGSQRGIKFGNQGAISMALIQNDYDLQIGDFPSSTFSPFVTFKYNSSGSTGFGETNPTARVQIKGIGSTAATTSLLVENSSGTAAMTIKDDLSTNLGGILNLVYNSSYISASGGANSSTTFIANTLAGWNGFAFGNSSLQYFAEIRTDRTNVYTPLFVTLVGNSSSAPPPTPNASAILQADSTTQGFLPPRMTDAQVRAIASPAIGLMAFNTDLDCPVFYSAAGWRKVSHSVM